MTQDPRELRRSARKRILILACFKTHEAAAEDRVIKAMTSDISMHGLFVLTNHSCRPGRIYNLRLVAASPEGKKLAEVFLPARAVRVNSDQPYGVGFEFVNPPNDELRRIIELAEWTSSARIDRLQSDLTVAEKAVITPFAHSLNMTFLSFLGKSAVNPKIFLTGSMSTVRDVTYKSDLSGGPEGSVMIDYDRKIVGRVLSVLRDDESQLTPDVLVETVKYFSNMIAGAAIRTLNDTLQTGIYLATPRIITGEQFIPAPKGLKGIGVEAELEQDQSVSVRVLLAESFYTFVGSKFS